MGLGTTAINVTKQVQLISSYQKLSSIEVVFPGVRLPFLKLFKIVLSSTGLYLHMLQCWAAGGIETKANSGKLSWDWG